jgi:hypothetical protein
MVAQCVRSVYLGCMETNTKPRHRSDLPVPEVGANHLAGCEGDRTPSGYCLPFGLACPSHHPHVYAERAARHRGDR